MEILLSGEIYILTFGVNKLFHVMKLTLDR